MDRSLHTGSCTKRAAPGRPACLGAGWALLAALACAPPAPPAPTQPRRAVLVTIDTLRADHVGAYGAGPGRTPVLDGLAAAGVRFENAISPAPLTLPSHATLLTGLDPPDHGVHHNTLFRLGENVPTLATHLRQQGFATAAFVGAFVLDARFGLARGFDVYDDQLALSGPTSGGASVAERPANEVTNAALAWIAGAPDRCFLWIHLYDPHAEHHPPEPFASRFSGDLYSGEIAFADEQVGRVLAAIEARWPDGATLVAVTSDHGESLGEHGEETHAYTIYDATQHVPLLLRGPGLPAGTTIGAMVRLADVAPSLVELLGAPPLPGAKGLSVRPLVAGEQDAPRTAYLETLATHFDWRWSPLFGIRSATRKYVRAPRPELYDLLADPGETRNLASAEPGLTAELDRALDERLGDRGSTRPNLALDAAERARLEALGYVAPTAEAVGALGSETLGVVGGTDPKDELHLVREMHRVNELLGEQRFEEALAAANGLGERGIEIEVLRVRAALGAGRLDVARALARRLVKDAPEYAFSHTVLGRVKEIDGDALGAAAAYERALALEAPSAAPLTGLGRLAEAAGRRDESRSYYERARRATIPDPEPTWRLAALALEAGDVERGSALLRELPQGHLRQEDAALRVARAELEAGRSELAQIRVDAGLLEQPGSLRLLQLRAEILDARGELVQARTALELLLARLPGNPALQNDLAWTLVRLGKNLPRALELAKAAVAGSERLPETLDTLAAVLAAQQRWGEAGAVIDEGLRRADGLTRARLLYRRAEVQAGLGQSDAARSTVAEARVAAGDALPKLSGEEQRVRARLGEASP